MSIKSFFIEGEKDKRKVTFRKNRLSKSIRISVSLDGDVLVTRPVFVSEKMAVLFFNQKRDWIEKKLKKISKYKVKKPSKKNYLKDKERARILLKDKIEYWNNFYGFSFNKLSVRNQKTRWGSCSSKKNLSFNYKIIFLSPELQDYLVIHELCHLKYMNHSKDFWCLVEKAVPNYKECSKKLRKVNPTL